MCMALHHACCTCHNRQPTSHFLRTTACRLHNRRRFRIICLLHAISIPYKLQAAVSNIMRLHVLQHTAAPACHVRMSGKNMVSQALGDASEGQ